MVQTLTQSKGSLESRPHYTLGLTSQVEKGSDKTEQQVSMLNLCRHSGGGGRRASCGTSASGVVQNCPPRLTLPPSLIYSPRGECTSAQHPAITWASRRVPKVCIFIKVQACRYIGAEGACDCVVDMRCSVR